MNSLEHRLNAIAKGEIEDEGGAEVLPDFDSKEMIRCVRAIELLVRSSTSKESRARLRPPSQAIHVIL